MYDGGANRLEATGIPFILHKLYWVSLVCTCDLITSRSECCMVETRLPNQPNTHLWSAVSAWSATAHKNWWDGKWHWGKCSSSKQRRPHQFVHILEWIHSKQARHGMTCSLHTCDAIHGSNQWQGKMDVSGPPFQVQQWLGTVGSLKLTAFACSLDSITTNLLPPQSQ